MDYYVYILTNYSRSTYYVGITNDIERRMFGHKNKVFPNSFTSKYKIDRLLYFEIYDDP